MPGVSVHHFTHAPEAAPAAPVADVVEAAREAVPSPPAAENLPQPPKDDAHVPSVAKSRKAGK